jgi:hypothetical protein
MAIWSAKVAGVAAGAKTGNVVAGRIGNPPSRPCAVRIGVTASAAGMRVTIFIGGRVFLNDEEISSANRMPEVDKDLVVDGELANIAELISVEGRNASAGAVDLFYKVETRELM